jgi:hypothetical protein
MNPRWHEIATAPEDEIVLLGWWFSAPGMGCSWEMDIDVPHESATHWRPLDDVEGILPPRPASFPRDGGAAQKAAPGVSSPNQQER